MELLIGRDATTSRLSITIDEKGKSLYGNANSVPKDVSRQHCKIIIEDKTFKVVNVNPNNITYVNGVQVMEKGFDHKADKITLGNSQYELKILDVLKALKLTPLEEYSISHLEEIWDDNHNTKLQLQIKEKKTAAIRSATGLISTISIVCACIPSMAMLRIPLVIIGVIVGIYFAITMYKSSSKMPLFLDNLDKEFRKKYICPNPKCNAFLGYQPYDEIVKKKGCPHCRSRFNK